MATQEIAESPASVAIESPDGEFVYFARGKKLWRAKTDGSREEQVTGMPEFDGLGGEWFPAKKGIYFLSHANGKTTINLFDRQSRQTRPIFTLEKPATMDRRNACFKGWQVHGLPTSGFRFQRPHDGRELAVSS